ncbi:MAG: hypothetical protein WAL45_03110 [Terracidiphilus sp.]
MPKKTDEPQAQAWLVEWTETEAGWGQRPDAAWYFPTEEAAMEATNRRLADQRAREKERESRSPNLPMEWSSPELPPLLVPVSAELAKEIREKGHAYRECAEQGGVWRVDWPRTEEA